MSTFITRFDTAGPGVRLAVKDVIDMAGVVTTAGCRAVVDEASPAAGRRHLPGRRPPGGARIVGRTNLHELALGVTGVNPWYGTPVNPLDPTLVPGGSSSGSAVAVATGEADVAYGTDTGGSVRIPSACCGTAGLKTTWGRIPLDGVWPLSPSFDTVGPMARDVAGLVTGMALLEPGFAVGPGGGSVRVGRIRVEADAPSTAPSTVPWPAPGGRCWTSTCRCGTTPPSPPACCSWWRRGKPIATWWRVIPATSAPTWWAGSAWEPRSTPGRAPPPSPFRRARRAELDALFERVDVIATPTLTIFPPRLDGGEELLMARCTLPVNLAGVPALALPVPSDCPLPASIQLIGPPGGEELLLSAGAMVEAAAGPLS